MRRRPSAQTRAVRETDPPPTVPAIRAAHLRPRPAASVWAIVDVVIADLTRDPRSEDYVVAACAPPDEPSAPVPRASEVRLAEARPARRTRRRRASA